MPGERVILIATTLVRVTASCTSGSEGGESTTSTTTLPPTLTSTTDAEAVAITDDVITAVGDRETAEALIGDQTQVKDLDGATAIPGLVDAHSHFFGERMTQGIGAGIQDAEILSNGITTTAELEIEAWGVPTGP